MTRWSCPTRDCYFDEDTHAMGAWCRHIEGVTHTEGFTHQHTVKRSRGGKEITALLCAYCHSEVDNGWKWANAVIEVLGRRYYRMWRVTDNATLIEREITNAFASNQERGSEVEQELVRTEDESIGAAAPDSVLGDSESSRVPVLSAEHGGGDTELTRSECIAEARRLRDERDRNPWSVGDLLGASRQIDDPDNSWDSETGASLTDILGIQPETCGQYERLAGLFPPPRVASMGHAQACFKQPDRDQWMMLARDENLSVAELRRRIRGDVEPKVKARKWTIGELRDALEAAERERDRLREALRLALEEWEGWVTSEVMGTGHYAGELERIAAARAALGEEGIG